MLPLTCCHVGAQYAQLPSCVNLRAAEILRMCMALANVCFFVLCDLRSTAVVQAVPLEHATMHDACGGTMRCMHLDVLR